MKDVWLAFDPSRFFVGFWCFPLTRALLELWIVHHLLGGRLQGSLLSRFLEVDARKKETEESFRGIIEYHYESTSITLVNKI